MANSTLFVLGADDPEMRRIEALIKETGHQVWYATKDSRRCHPGNAYLADEVMWDEYQQLVLVECQPVHQPNPLRRDDVIRVDHHRQGDPGYGLPPEQFWQASSLGQIYALLFQDQNSMRY